MDRVTGGSLEVSAGRADEGETVTITAVPDDGYELKKLTVTDSQDGAVPVQNAGEGRYTFVMPGGGVTVSASFVRSGEQTELRSGGLWSRGSPPVSPERPSPRAADAHGPSL